MIRSLSRCARTFAHKRCGLRRKLESTPAKLSFNKQNISSTTKATPGRIEGIKSQYTAHSDYHSGEWLCLREKIPRSSSPKCLLVHHEANLFSATKAKVVGGNPSTFRIFTQSFQFAFPQLRSSCSSLSGSTILNGVLETPPAERTE